MKIGIITHYEVHNHGAILQLNALIKVLEKKKIKAFALRFDKNYDFVGPELKHKYEIGIRSIPLYINYLRRQGIKQTLFNIKKKSLLEGFKSKYDLVNGYYTEYKKLDAVCIGS